MKKVAEIITFVWAQYWFLFAGFFLLLAAILVRFLFLGSMPAGITWDEAAIGYNGHMVINTRRDEWLHRLPVSFQSFGDFKAPLAIYIVGLSTTILGLTPFAVRLPFFLASILSILAFTWFVIELWKDTPYQKSLAVFTLLLLCFVPWHVHFSRAGFESGMAMAFFLMGVAVWWFCFNRLEQLSSKTKFFLILSAWFLTLLSVYTYHSAKVTVPLVWLGVLYWSYPKWKSSAKTVFKAAGLVSLLGIPLLKDAVFGQGLTRANTSIFSLDLGFGQQITTIISNFAAHLSPQFLIYGQTTTLRHSDGVWGVLLPTDLVLLFFLILGLVGMVVYKNFGLLRENQSLKSTLFLGTLFVVAGLLPAAIGQEIPHSNRALLALPGFILLELAGLFIAITWLKHHALNSKVHGSHGEKNSVFNSFIAIFITVHVFYGLSYAHHLFTEYPAASTESFASGYLEAFELAEEYMSGQKGVGVDQVLMTSEYGQPYIFGLFVTQLTPQEYAWGHLYSRYMFVDKIDWGSLDKPRRLVIAGQKSPLDPNQADHVIRGPDGSVRFYVFYTGEGEN